MDAMLNLPVRKYADLRTLVGNRAFSSWDDCDLKLTCSARMWPA